MTSEELDIEIERHTGWWRKSIGPHRDRIWVRLDELLKEREARERSGNGKRRDT